MSEPMQVDAADLTLREVAELEEASGVPLAQLMEHSQARGIAGIAWLIKRRTDPDFTLDQALDLKMSDLEIVQGEAPAVSNGGTPHASPALGS